MDQGSDFVGSSSDNSVDTHDQIWDKLLDGLMDYQIVSITLQ